MTTPTQPPNHVLPPPPAQLALAMAIVKHKPPNMDINDHIHQIRQFIKRTPSNPTQHDKFFDSVAFWQQAYEKSEAEQSRLLDQIYELEMRNESLVAKVQGRDAGGLAERVEVGKRKGNAYANVSAGTRKRAKTQGLAQGSGLGGLVGGGIGKVGDLDDATASFMRQFYTLQKALQKKANHANIVVAAVSLCKTVESEMLDAVGERSTGTGRSKTALPHTEQLETAAVIRSVECAFQLLIQAIGKISGPENGMHDVGQVTYHLVCLYDAVVKALQKRCQSKAQLDTAKSKSNAKSTKQKQAPKTLRPRTGRNQETPSKPEDEIAIQITHLLGTMVFSLNISCIEHQDLLEGFLFILLTRVGKILCLFVFQDLQLQPDLYIDPAKLPLPEGLIGADLSDASLLAAQLETRHLIWLLERILTLLDIGSASSVSSDATDHRARFVLNAKERLQGTLLQAVFGTDQPFFQMALQRPISPAVIEIDGQQEVQVPDMPLSDMPLSDRFVQEVWRLLGWEMLVEEPTET